MQTWPDISWAWQDMAGFNEAMVPVKEYGHRAEQPFLSTWARARADKLQAASTAKTPPSGKAGRSGPPICWLYEKAECKWAAKCKYRHACANCDGGHPVSDCRKSKPASEGRPNPGRPRY